MTLSPDGSWLAATVQAPGPDGKKQVSSIWRIDTGQGRPARLTWSPHGETGPAFLPDGSLLFISQRAQPAGGGGEPPADRPSVWVLPASGGESYQVAAPAGGAAKLTVARLAGTVLLAAQALPGTKSAEDDAARRKARQDLGVTAILHEGGPVRFWDHDLGPDCTRLLAGQLDLAACRAGEPAALADLTPEPGRALDEQSFWLSPDGAVAASGWRVHGAGEAHTEVVLFDLATSRRRTLMADADADFNQPAISPDGTMVVAIRAAHHTYARPGDSTLVITALDAAEPAGAADLLAGFDRRPLSLAWAPDSASVYFTADDNGRRPVFRADVSSGKVTQVTSDDAAYDCLCPAPDGLAVYALRSAISEPPAPVRIELAEAAAGPVRLASPVGGISVPGHVEELSVQAADGAVVRSWLVLPEGASPDNQAPLLLWVHGGPEMSWNAWSWRWNPWLMAARGYAVLLPDPALSTGYGNEFVARGHGEWGGRPYADLMTVTDAATARPDIDASRTAMMGASFGGYMANWIAGHTDRFAAIVSHAGLWALDQMFGTSDLPVFWRRTYGDPAVQPARYLDNSPHLHADRIVTPMLIIHGDKDYRVPIGEALRLYWDLTSRGKPAKFLYFAQENHWVLQPGDVRVWYETVFAFLAEHVLGMHWQRPALL